MEKWYLLLGLGGSFVFYPKDLKNEVNKIPGMSLTNGYGQNWDFGIYLNHDDYTVYGAIMNVTFNGIKINSSSGPPPKEINIEYFLYSLTLKRYIRPYKRRLFYHMDAGFALHRAKLAKEGTTLYETQKYGLGATVGFGYEKFFVGTRISAGLDYSFLVIGLELWNRFGISLNFIF